MYNKNAIDNLVRFIYSNNGIADKTKLSNLVKDEFSLLKKRSVFVCDDFSIRFCKAKDGKIGNTVLGLSVLKNYDSKPFFVCAVSQKENYLLIANTTFLKKISHSSKELRIDNIRGSFNGSDIIKDFNGIRNEPINFEELYEIHCGYTFDENLERLVESTNNIVGYRQKYNVTNERKSAIIDSIKRAQEFIDSKEYDELKKDFNDRIEKVREEIIKAAQIDNVKMRGNVIEYLITDDESDTKRKILKALRAGTALPEFKIKDELGDYSCKFAEYEVETDIKTKILERKGNPKGCNIDKMLEFLSKDKSVYMIYLLGINSSGRIKCELCSIFDTRLIGKINIVNHWSGRDSRGTIQFFADTLESILYEKTEKNIDLTKSLEFIEKLIDR